MLRRKIQSGTTQGEKGIAGIQGDKGIAGIQGDKGIQGEKGIAGQQGDKGIAGIAGDDVKGQKGEPGQKGEAPTTIQPPAPLYLTARYEQLSHIHPKVGIGAVAANAFLFTHNADTYVITSAHTLFSEPMAPTATLPSMVKLGQTELVKKAYSRFFDVAIFQKPQEVTATAYSSISAGDGSATAHFEDPNADIQFTHVANYTENINRRTQTGVFFYPLMQGSSGSAISRNGKLVGMVSGVDQKYDNLTVCVPAQTIVDLIAKIPTTWNDDVDLDLENIFPKMLTAPIPKPLRSYFPGVLSHLVLYAKDNHVLPLSMIEANVANKALKGDTSFQVRRISTDEKYRRWFRFPREVYGYRDNNYFKVGTSVVASINDFVSDQAFDDMCWEGMNVMVSANPDFLQNRNNSDNDFQQPTQINRKDLSKDKKAELFPMSTVYTRFFNKKSTADNFLSTTDVTGIDP
ncbi:MAG: collagen-like protein, partial [Verrucomicrobiota bacterium]|nr:collagen-like protein [Verrucomicrobiota bacterium]